MESRGDFLANFARPPSSESSHRMGEGLIFIKKNLRASLFNDDVSNESNFGHIYLVGQSLSIYPTYTNVFINSIQNEKIRSR
jgi:hypothetical protein